MSTADTIASIGLPTTSGRCKMPGVVPPPRQRAHDKVLDAMKMQPTLEPARIFDLRYAAFLETVADLRGRLHRYCARMTGSVLDAEDVMQETLFEIYRNIDKLDDPRALRPWLFRTAHNRCIDFLRNRQVRQRAEANLAVDEI